jgi:voltage-gated potassium channel
MEKYLLHVNVIKKYRRIIMKNKLWLIFGKNDTGTTYSKIINTSLFILIILNIFAVIIGTVNNLNSNFIFFLSAFEYFSISIFVVEWFIKIYSSNVVYSNRFKYIFSFDSIIDVISIIPTIFIFIPFDGRILRAIRLFRIIRFAKMTKYSKAISIFLIVFKRKKEELILSFSVMFIFLIILSCIMYYIEYTAQPQVFSDIPSTIWWSITTLTTVGYGDMYPITVLGKIIAGIVSFLGIGVFAIPAGIISSGFMENIKITKKCPHCDKIL